MRKPFLLCNFAITLFLFIHAAASHAETLNFRNESVYFLGQREKNNLHIETSSPIIWSVTINDCNKSVIDSFWKQAKAHLDRVRPKAPIGKNANIIGQIDKKKFKIFQGDSRLVALRRLPAEVNVLKLRVEKKCKQ